MAKMKEPDKLDKLIAELTKDATAEELVKNGGLLKELKKRLMESALEAEMTEHLGYEKHSPDGRNTGNSRNGKTPKRIIDGDGELEYVDDFMIPQLKELIDAYHPAYLSFDGEWDHGYPYWRSRQIVAYFYNQAAARGQEVLVNDRFGQAKDGVSDTRGVYGDMYHNEYNVDIDRTKPWAMWRGFGNSYGYNRTSTTRTS